MEAQALVGIRPLLPQPIQLCSLPHPHHLRVLLECVTDSEFHLDLLLDIDLTSRWWCPVEVHREVPCVPKVHTQRVPLFQLRAVAVLPRRPRCHCARHCGTWVSLTNYVHHLTTHHCPVLMLVRTYALYNCSRRVAIGLSTILVMGGVVSVVSFSISCLVWPCQRPAAYLLRTSGRSVRPCMTSTILPAGRRSITPAASWRSQKLSKESRVLSRLMTVTC